MSDIKYHVVAARRVGRHTVWLEFRDGTSGEIDLLPALRGPIFEPLRDPTIFKQFTIHPEFPRAGVVERGGTLRWSSFTTTYA